MATRAVIVALACCLAGLQVAAGRKDMATYCGGRFREIIAALSLSLSPAACKAVVDELSYEVGKMDPKKTIQVREREGVKVASGVCFSLQTGSYRVGSDGSQSGSRSKR